MALRGLVSYWWIPVFSAAVWLGTLLGLLLWWIVTVDERRLPTVSEGMTLPYISDIGALELKPLFIAGSAVTTVSFSLAFALERWLRHLGRLAPNRNTLEKTLSVLSIVFALAGTAGLILLSVFDTMRHPRLHNGFLVLFIGGFLLSAIFICWEHQRLGAKYRQYRVLRASFWIKLTFIIVEVALVITFGALASVDNKRVGAYIEWIIALIYTFYVLSFVIDLWPARLTKDPSQRFSKAGQFSLRDMEDASGFSDGSLTPGHQARADGQVPALVAPAASVPAAAAPATAANF